MYFSPPIFQDIGIKLNHTPQIPTRPASCGNRQRTWPPSRFTIVSPSHTDSLSGRVGPLQNRLYTVQPNHGPLLQPNGAQVRRIPDGPGGPGRLWWEVSGRTARPHLEASESLPGTQTLHCCAAIGSDAPAAFISSLSAELASNSLKQARQRGTPVFWHSRRHAELVVTE
jgi:hypothetical protein